MSKHPSHDLDFNVSEDFRAAQSSESADDQEHLAKNSTHTTQKKTSPICVRVTDDERARLENAAGKTAISTYIRTCLFEDDAEHRAKRYGKKSRTPAADSVLIAKLLGMLGQDDMVRAIFALLVAAESDRVAMSDEAQESLDQVCSHIEEIREMLIIALNVKPKGQCR